MMQREIDVCVDLDGAVLPVGTLWARVRRGRETATFRYADEWLTRPDRFALEPALALGQAPQGKVLFGALGDSAPDRWGRELLAHAERQRAREEGRSPRTLFEIDYLLGVTDTARQGALRFRTADGGPFLAEDTGASIPPLIALARLLAANRGIEEGDPTGEQLRLLLAPGSSLGGARPKASVWDRDDQLSIAKFPSKSDEIDVVRWEAVELTLADRAGIAVPRFRLEQVAGDVVLIVRRFDRRGAQRTPFLSAMSMIGAYDREQHSYLELVDALRMHGARPKSDMHDLWRRIVFNVLTSNTDDHLRNHGFLWDGPAGWSLSPAYDLNPVPVDIRPRVLCTAIDTDDPTASIELALGVSPYFELDETQARAIARAVAEAVSGWREVAAAAGLTPAERERMSSAFEHDDQRQALAL